MAEKRAASERAAAEGTHAAPVLPRGLRRVPAGVDELATEHLVVNMGPQHPSTHGVLHILLELDGEEVVAAEASLGYLHRGVEKLAEHRRYHQVPTLLDRCDYISGFHSEWAWALAVEDLAGIEVPPRADAIRALMAELNRLSSHLLWLGTFGMDAGAMGPFLYTLRDREALLDIFEAVAGSRMMFNYIRPGGVVADLPAEALPMVERFLETFPRFLDEYDGLLTGNEIFQDRLKGVGIIDADTALAFGMTGANLRAAGVPWDVRRGLPYGPYADLAFEVPLGTVGDLWDRWMVRIEEMRQSVGIVRQLIAEIPEGDFTAKVPKVLRPPAGEAYVCVESPRGELGVHVVSDGSDTPYRVRLRPPALYNLSVVDEVLPGCLIADAVVVVGGLDIILGEIDR